MSHERDAKTARSSHMPGLDVVRFWAAGLVAAFHLGYWSWIAPDTAVFRVAGGSVRYESLEPFTWFGWCGVETFFVISGCVICISAEQATPYQFLRSRIGRLYPAVWVCASLAMLVSLALHLSPVPQLALEYVRSLGIFFTRGPWIDGVYRTLIPEGVFYALIFLVLATGRFRHIQVFAMLLGSYSLAVWIVGMSGVVTLQPGIGFYFSKNALFFALGVMIWVTQRRGASLARVLAIAILAAAGTFEVHCVSLNILPAAKHGQAFVAVYVWLASLAAVMAAVFCNAPIVAFVGSRARHLRTLGLMTYPLYLIHDVVGASVLRTSAVVGQVPALVLAVLVSLVLAYVVMRLEPLIRQPLLTGLDALKGDIDRRLRWMRGAGPLPTVVQAGEG